MTPPIFSQFSSGGGGRATGFGMGPMEGGGLYKFTSASFQGTGSNPNGPNLSQARSMSPISSLVKSNSSMQNAMSFSNLVVFIVKNSIRIVVAQV